MFISLRCEKTIRSSFSHSAPTGWKSGVPVSGEPCGVPAHQAFLRADGAPSRVSSASLQPCLLLPPRLVSPEPLIVPRVGRARRAHPPHSTYSGGATVAGDSKFFSAPSTPFRAVFSGFPFHFRSSTLHFVPRSSPPGTGSAPTPPLHSTPFRSGAPLPIRTPIEILASMKVRIIFIGRLSIRISPD